MTQDGYEMVVQDQLRMPMLLLHIWRLRLTRWLTLIILCHLGKQMQNVQPVCLAGKLFQWYGILQNLTL